MPLVRGSEGLFAEGSADVASAAPTDGRLSSGHYAAYGVLSGVAMVLPGLAVFLLGLVLSSSSYGLLVVFATISSLVFVGSDSGFNITTTLFASEASTEREHDEVMAGGIGARLVLGLVATAIALGFLPAILDGASGWRGWVGASLACVGALVASLAAGLRIGVRVREPLLEAKLSLLEKVAVSAVTFAVVAAFQLPATYGLALSVPPLLIVGWSSRLRHLAQRSAAVLRSDSARRVVKAQLRATIPFAVSVYATTLYWRVDVLLISALLGEDAAGTYALAYYPVMALANVPGAASVLFLRRQSAVGSNSFARHVVMHALAGFGALVVVNVIVVPVLGVLPMDAVTDQSSAVLRVASLSLVPVFVNPVIAQRLRACGFAWRVTALAVVGLVANLALNLFLLPRHGIVAASWASNVTEWLVLLGLAIILVSRRQEVLQ